MKIFNVEYNGISVLGAQGKTYRSSFSSIILPQLIAEKFQNKALDVLDLGCGVGTIAIAFKKACDKANVVGIDNNEFALDFAKLNAKINETDVQFMVSDKFDAVSDRKFDLIITNIPCVSEEWYNRLYDRLKDKTLVEPKDAYVAGENRNDVIDVVMDSAKQYLKKDGWIYFFTPQQEQDKEVEQLFIAKEYAEVDNVRHQCVGGKYGG